MKNTLILVMCMIVVAASALVIADKVESALAARKKNSAPVIQGPALSTHVDPAILARLDKVERVLEAVRQMLQIQPPDAAETRDAENPGPPQGAGLGERLQWIEGELNDLRRQNNRDLMQIFARLRRRLDEMESKLVKEGTPDSRSTIADLKKLGVDYQSDKQLISMDAAFVQPSRVLEFVAVGSGGNAYESLLVVNAKPSALKRALEMMGVAEAPDPPYDAAKLPKEMGVYLYVTWPDRKAPIRLEKLLLNNSTGKPLALTPFLFTASRSFIDNKTWDEHLAADVYKNTIALTWDKAADAILACPDKDAESNHVWMPATDVVPEPPTPATLYVSKDVRPEWE